MKITIEIEVSQPDWSYKELREKELESKQWSASTAGRKEAYGATMHEALAKLLRSMADKICEMSFDEKARLLK